MCLEVRRHRGRSGLLQLREQVDLEVGDREQLLCAGLVGQPNGRAKQTFDVSDVALLVRLLCNQRRLKARHEPGEQAHPHGSHVLLLFGEVDDDDRPSGFPPCVHGLGERAGIVRKFAEGLGLDGRVVRGRGGEAQVMVGILGNYKQSFRGASKGGLEALDGGGSVSGSRRVDCSRAMGELPLHVQSVATQYIGTNNVT